jgi:ABC-type polysaccharide/polyol phosphate transport system ATPase subunit
MSDVIQVHNVYKQYDTIGTLRIRTILQDAVRAMRATSAMKQITNPDAKYVLNDINFSLAEGKSLGLIGHNGSGKTTLLRLLAGVSLPTRGNIKVVGKVAPLLALGAGFHQELSGYENLFLNCTLMGLSRKQSLQRIDEIIEFADIGEYIGVPIKRYSSGMLARLGFSAAIHMEPEVILLDEVLAVGDYNFSVKASNAIQEFAGKGTLVFVSHDLNSVKRLCERVIWIDHGRVRADGPSGAVVADYLEVQQEKLEGGAMPITVSDERLNTEAHKVIRDARVDILSVTTHNKLGEPQTKFDFGEDIIIRCHLQLFEPIPDMRITIGITDIASRAFITACDNQQLAPIGDKAGDLILEGHFPAMKIRPHGLGVRINISNPVLAKPLGSWNDIVPRFLVVGPKRDPEHHYYEPQGDLVYTPNVKMLRKSGDEV